MKERRREDTYGLNMSSSQDLLAYVEKREGREGEKSGKSSPTNFVNFAKWSFLHPFCEPQDSA